MARRSKNKTDRNARVIPARATTSEVCPAYETLTIVTRNRFGKGDSGTIGFAEGPREALLGLRLEILQPPIKVDNNFEEEPKTATFSAECPRWDGNCETRLNLSKVEVNPSEAPRWIVIGEFDYSSMTASGYGPTTGDGTHAPSQSTIAAEVSATALNRNQVSLKGYHVKCTWTVARPVDNVFVPMSLGNKTYDNAGQMLAVKLTSKMPRNVKPTIGLLNAETKTKLSSSYSPPDKRAYCSPDVRYFESAQSSILQSRRPSMTPSYPDSTGQGAVEPDP